MTNDDMVHTPRDVRKSEMEELQDAVTPEDYQMALAALAEAENIPIDELRERFNEGRISTDEFEVSSELAMWRVEREWIIAHGRADRLPGPTARVPIYAELVEIARSGLETLARRYAPGWTPGNEAERSWMVQHLFDVHFLRVNVEMLRDVGLPIGDEAQQAAYEAYLAAEQERVEAWMRREDDQVAED